MLRSAFLRYLPLDAEGGVYSDLDAAAVKPICNWLLPELRSKVHAVVDIEYDQRDDEPDIRMSGTRLHSCWWTMAASPGHAILESIIQNVVVALHELARRKNTSIFELHLSGEEVMAINWTHYMDADRHGRPLRGVRYTYELRQYDWDERAVIVCRYSYSSDPWVRHGHWCIYQALVKGSCKHDWNH